MAVLFVKQGWPVVAGDRCSRSPSACAIGLVYARSFNRFGVPELRDHAGRPAGLPRPAAVGAGRARASINLPFDSGPGEVRAAALRARLALLRAGRCSRRGGCSRDRLRCTPASGARRAVGRVDRGCCWSQRSCCWSVLVFAVWYLNRTRGVGWMFVFFVALVLVMHYVLDPTKWGRSVYAVGGNVEAARRAGINVGASTPRSSCSAPTLAAIGGILAAARLAAANQSSGSGDVNLNAIAAAVIGGTSLFGGRGRPSPPLLGILVIQSISSGLTLLEPRLLLPLHDHRRGAAAGRRRRLAGPPQPAHPRTRPTPHRRWAGPVRRMVSRWVSPTARS